MKRIQRKRTKGWKMPPNTIYVGRPSKFGNPFRLNKDKMIEYWSEIYKRWYLLSSTTNHNEEGICQLYKDWITKSISVYFPLPEPPDIEELRGKDLACWCPLDKPCHADILIQLLNI